MEVDCSSTAEDKDDKTIEAAAVPTESPKKAEESSAVVPEEKAKAATPTKVEASSGDAAVLPVVNENSIEENKAEEVKATAVDETTKTATAECK